MQQLDLASKMTFLGDWGCASNKQNALGYVREHCMLTCEATIISSINTKNLVKVLKFFGEG